MVGTDWALIAIVGLSALIGLIRGITREVLGLLAWIGAGVCAFFSLPLVRHIARSYITNPMLADAAAVIVIFIAFLILFSILSYLLSGYVRESALGGVDRSLGFGFGILRAVVLISVMELVISSFVPRYQHPDFIKNARFSGLVYSGSDQLYALLPSSIKEMINQQRQKIPQDFTQDLQDPILRNLVPQTVKINPEQAVEALADLKPKADSSKTDQKDSSYSDNQRGDMERLLATSEHQPPEPQPQALDDGSDTPAGFE